MSKKRVKVLGLRGKTAEGCPVIGGVFKLYDTIGLPLEVIIDKMNDRGLVIDWQDFYTSSIKAGWKSTTAIKRIDEALGDAKGKVYKEKVLKRLSGYEMS